MVCTSRFFFAFFSLFRVSLNVGLLERPLVIGLFWGCLTGNYVNSFNIAIFFELFWLDLIPVGTFIPPHLTAATFSALSLSTFFGLTHPAKIMGVLFASMPLALLGTRVEAWFREQERGSYNSLLHWARKPNTKDLPARLILRSVLRSLLLSWGAFFCAILVLKFTFKTVFTLYPAFLTSIDITWPHLWIAASMGGLMALRLKRAYAVLTTGVILITLFVLYGRF
ncbi:PTS sugar transporter subunit IIC [Pseudodesulfovibrio piezophilus]|uniref:Uncharacterized protein n=1 Tax=Pseudodesulfovibrio piezophilus (strain DSM 21447 / JCM 15486 / C1TLV30) TaxID=1322246 RepID=M1WJF0_PSEP2|nr:PTS sugar transporter subunit IIC [Pseudodesulfovibrio piezophilus]CCH47781.1 conserved membrane protein of unknown function [Pseudodesulfovibrio piezophilus C1TLV30]